MDGHQCDARLVVFAKSGEGKSYKDEVPHEYHRQYEWRQPGKEGEGALDLRIERESSAKGDQRKNQRQAGANSAQNETLTRDETLEGQR